MFVRSLFFAGLFAVGQGNQELDDMWMQFLEAPPDVSVSLAQELNDRADELAATLPDDLAVAGDIDFSISGGGNFDAYYMGVQMVFNRVKALSMHRYTGASAGGMMPFELVLKGENTTLLTHLSYGELTARFPGVFGPFGNPVSAAATQDHHWRLMASWQTSKYADSLHTLDDKVFLALSCLDPILPKLVIVSEFTAENDQATHAFMATGTAVETYDGMICSDGGSTSGPNMTPLFQDGIRPQVIVDLMHTGAPSELVYKIVTGEYYGSVKLGQDEAVEFLKTGAVARDAQAITLCPVGSKVSGNVCEAPGASLV